MIWLLVILHSITFILALIGFIMLELNSGKIVAFSYALGSAFVIILALASLSHDILAVVCSILLGAILTGAVAWELNK